MTNVMLSLSITGKKARAALRGFGGGRPPLVMAALLLAAGGSPSACRAGDLKREFSRSYQPTTAALRKHLAENRRIRLMVTNYVGGGQMVSKVELELLANSSCLLGKELSAVREGNDFSFQGVKPVWYLCRPDHIFTIAPTKNSGHHVITGMTKPREHWEQIDLPVRLALYPLVEPLSQLSIVDYVSQDGIEVVGMEERPWQGSILTRVEVRDPLHRAKQVWHRRLYFDRAKNWLFHGMEHYGDEGPERMYVARCFYRASEGGLPVPEKYEAYLEEGGARRPRVRVEYLEFAQANPDDSEFRLARFDLPEPEALSDRAPTRWNLWLFAAGGLVGLLAMVASRYARQKEG